MLKIGCNYEFHSTSKNIIYLLHKKKKKNAKEIFTLSVREPKELKEYLYKAFSDSKINLGSNIYNISVQQIIDCIKRSKFHCYSISKNGKQIGEIAFDARGKILDTLTKRDIESIIKNE